MGGGAVKGSDIGLILKPRQRQRIPENPPDVPGGPQRAAGCSTYSIPCSLFDSVLDREADELLLPVEMQLVQDVSHVVLDRLG